MDRKNTPLQSSPREPAPPSARETPASLAALRRSRREAWRAGIFVVATMFLIMLILLAGAWWLINRK